MVDSTEMLNITEVVWTERIQLVKELGGVAPLDALLVHLLAAVDPLGGARRLRHMREHVLLEARLQRRRAVAQHRSQRRLPPRSYSGRMALRP